MMSKKKNDEALARQASEVRQQFRHIERHLREPNPETGFANDQEMISALRKAIHNAKELLASIQHEKKEIHA